MPRGVNAKQEAGRAKKAENEAKKQAALDKKREEAEAAAWSVGSNAKGAARSEAAAQKADEVARKKREKAELLAAEEAELGSGGNAKAKKALYAANKKKSKGKKDDLSLLEDALQSAADKKVKKKRASQLEQKRKEEEAAKKKADEPVAPVDPLLANTLAMIDGMDSGRAANKTRMEDAMTSGLDAALDTLKVGSTNSKAVYAEFEAKMLPQVKVDYPGLRLTQYKEKVFALWKKSPENPANALQLS